jgi:hypothetical protein
MDTITYYKGMIHIVYNPPKVVISRKERADSEAKTESNK